MVSGPDIMLVNKSRTYSCSSRDRLGFYAEIQIIFGTVRPEVSMVFPDSWRQPPGEETGPEAGTGIQGGQTPSPTG